MAKKKAVTRRHAARRIVAPSSSGLLFPMSGGSSLSSSASVSPTHDASGSLGPPRLGLPTSSSSDEARRGQKSRRKRRSSGDDEALGRQDDEASDVEEREAEQEQEKVITVTQSELEQWQQRVIFHVEDHFSNEQLKRIAEFGRVHATMLQEAKQHVANVEEQMRIQLGNEREELRAQAEEFVAKTKKENEALRQRAQSLEKEVDGLQKQVDTLEQQVGVLQLESAQEKQHIDGVEMQRNCDSVQQLHPQPHSDRSDRGEDEEQMDEDVENNPTNDRNGYRPGEESNTSLSSKELDGLNGHSLPVNSTERTPSHLTYISKDRHPEQHQRHQSPQPQVANSTPPDISQSSSGMDSSDPHLLGSREVPASGAG